MIRTRFAPSPTGFQHIGGLRTCLYNYLLAKKHGGTFILRIEDTDQTRFVEGAAEDVMSIFPEKLGIHFDEGPYIDENAQPIPGDRKLTHLKHKGSYGPYIQSQRTEIYQKYAKELLEKGKAYYCFCTPEELEKMREEQTAMKLAPMYDRRCLKLSPEQIQEKLAAKIPAVIRQKIPREKRIEFKDIIRGKVSFHGSTIDDQILLKSDSLPTYHLANVIDDHLMEITHVIRGEEWLTSTPKHLELYEAFGWKSPEYAHLPLLLNADKTKLSKRQNDVSVESYLSQGYLKEALINFVVLLGWHPGKGVEKEIFTTEELIKEFSLEHVNKAGAVFNREKLDWFNFQWQRKLHFEKLSKIAQQLEPEVKINQKSETELEYHFSSSDHEMTFLNERAKLLLGMIKPHLDKKYEAEVNTFQNLSKILSDSSLLRALLVNEEKILKNPKDINSLVKYFFEPAPLDSALLINQKMGIENLEQAQNYLKIVQDGLKNFSNFESLEKIKNYVINIIKEAQLKNGQVLWPMRIALTHEQFSVGAFETVWVLGKEETLKRLEEVLK